MEHKGVFLSGLHNYMDQLETTQTLCSWLCQRKREAEEHRTHEVFTSYCMGCAYKLSGPFASSCSVPYLVCHVLDLDIPPFRVHVGDLHISSGRGGDVGYMTFCFSTWGLACMGGGLPSQDRGLLRKLMHLYTEEQDECLLLGRRQTTQQKKTIKSQCLINPLPIIHHR